MERLPDNSSFYPVYEEEVECSLCGELMNRNGGDNGWDCPDKKCDNEIADCGPYDVNADEFGGPFRV